MKPASPQMAAEAAAEDASQLKLPKEFQPGSASALSVAEVNILCDQLRSTGQTQ